MKSGVVQPKLGVNPAYDTAEEELQRVQGELEGHLRKYKKELQCSLTFHGTGKNR